jgi:hypothetical protein
VAGDQGLVTGAGGTALALAGEVVGMAGAGAAVGTETAACPGDAPVPRARPPVDGEEDGVDRAGSAPGHLAIAEGAGHRRVEREARSPDGMGGGVPVPRRWSGERAGVCQRRRARRRSSRRRRRSSRRASRRCRRSSAAMARMSRLFMGMSWPPAVGRRCRRRRDDGAEARTIRPLTDRAPAPLCVCTTPPVSAHTLTCTDVQTSMPEAHRPAGILGHMRRDFDPRRGGRLAQAPAGRRLPASVTTGRRRVGRSWP